MASHMPKAGAEVIGIDSSASMVQSAQSKGIEACVGSGEEINVSAKFDAVFSNAALHWMHDYFAVPDGVYRALKTPGRFVGEFGGSGNIGWVADYVRIRFEALKV